MESRKIDPRLVVWVMAGFGVAIFVTGLLISRNDLPKQIPLWYSRPWGESQLTAPRNLVIIPLLMVAVAVLTNFITSSIRKIINWKQIFGWSGVIAEGILAVSLLRIWILAI